MNRIELLSHQELRDLQKKYESQSTLEHNLIASGVDSEIKRREATVTEETLQQEIKAKDNEIESLEKDVDDLKYEMDDLQKHNGKEIKGLEKKIDSLNDQIKDLKTEIDTLKL